MDGTEVKGYLVLLEMREGNERMRDSAVVRVLNEGIVVRDMASTFENERKRKKKNRGAGGFRRRLRIRKKRMIEEEGFETRKQNMADSSSYRCGL